VTPKWEEDGSALELRDTLEEWWTPDRFRMALLLLQERRRRRREPASEDRIAAAMKLDPRTIHRYKTGEYRPNVRVLFFIDRTMAAELGRSWTEYVEREIERSSRRKA
jgi:hypothetical protein